MESQEARGRRKTQVGTVISDKMDKTVTVLIERVTIHRMYKKRIRKRSKFKAHDEGNVCRVGDKVLIEESRPLSKEKCWRVRQVIEKAL